MMLDAARKPVLHFRFHPAYGAQADSHSGRKSAFGLELVIMGGSDSAWASCHPHQSYRAPTQDHEPGYGGKTRQYPANRRSLA